jgi:hypothetical protein
MGGQIARRDSHLARPDRTEELLEARQAMPPDRLLQTDHPTTLPQIILSQLNAAYGEVIGRRMELVPGPESFNPSTSAKATVSASAI